MLNARGVGWICVNSCNRDITKSWRDWMTFWYVTMKDLCKWLSKNFFSCLECLYQQQRYIHGEMCIREKRPLQRGLGFPLPLLLPVGCVWKIFKNRRPWDVLIRRTTLFSAFQYRGGLVLLQALLKSNHFPTNFNLTLTLDLGGEFCYPGGFGAESHPTSFWGLSDPELPGGTTFPFWT